MLDSFTQVTPHCAATVRMVMKIHEKKNDEVSHALADLGCRTARIKCHLPLVSHRKVEKGLGVRRTNIIPLRRSKTLACKMRLGESGEGSSDCVGVNLPSTQSVRGMLKCL